MKCDLHLKLEKGENHTGLYMFRLEGLKHIYVCASCLEVLVKKAWDEKSK